MSTHDYPDWQGGENVRSPVLVNQTGFSLPAASTPILSNTPTLHYPYLYLYGSVSGNGGQIDVFFSDSNGLQAPNDCRFLVNQNVFSYTLPVLMDQVQIQVNRDAGAAATLNLYACLTEVPYYRTQLPLEVVLTLQTSGLLAQNASQEFALFPYYGFAQFEVESTQAGFLAQLKCYDLNATTVIGRSTVAQPSVATTSFQAWCPSTINTLRVLNTNAAAANITVVGFAQSAVPK